MRREDLHTLTGAYAVDALDARERADFEAHLRLCPACAQEVEEFKETAAHLGAAVSEPPPPGLRTAVLGEVSTVRQDPPRRRHGERRGWFGLTDRPLAVAASLLAILSMTLGALFLSSERDADRAQQRADQIAALLADPNAVTASGNATTAGRGTVVAAGSKAVFSAADLPALASNRTYQLWLVGPKETRSAGVLDRADDGRVSRLVQGLRRGDAIALSVEPHGGSKQPTTKPVLVIPVRS